MSIIANKKVGKVVAENFKTAKIFSQFGIDFCCGGGITVAEACAAQQVDLEDVVMALDIVNQTPDAFDYESKSAKELVEHIVNQHHNYVRETLPVLQAYIEKIARVHGERHPELIQIHQLFEESAAELSHHLEKEEMILFPYIEALEAAQNQGVSKPSAAFGSIDNPIAMMEHEHDTEGNRFKEIAQLSNNYTPPADACQTYRVAFKMLEEFENDLHTHIHLENNILFPKGKEMYEN